MKFDYIDHSISSGQVSCAARKVGAIILELGIRENNEHVGSGLGGNNYQMLSFIQMKHHLVTSGDTITSKENILYWDIDYVLSSSLKNIRKELDRVFKTIGNEFKIVANVLNANVGNPTSFMDFLLGSDPGGESQTMACNIMVGEKIDLSNLSYIGQIMIATLLCYNLATNMDHTGVEPRLRDIYIDNVGLALRNVEPEVFLISVRKCIGIDRLVKFNLDEHPSWSSMFNEINRSVN